MQTQTENGREGLRHALSLMGVVDTHDAATPEMIENNLRIGPRQTYHYALKAGDRITGHLIAYLQGGTVTVEHRRGLNDEGEPLATYGWQMGMRYHGT
ncbi:MAG: hypothetical protein HYT70_01475 [Candidatus Aenigmarchaeota archaeon]|nr:hypothetical protein [Candidatus Aenigmarchaeota archaeon]